MTTLRDLSRLEQKARDAGALAAELLVETREGVALEVSRGAVSRRTPIATDRMVVRVWRAGGSEGVAEGPVETAEGLLLAALRASEDSPPDPHAGPSPPLEGYEKGLGIDDRRHSQLTADDKTEVVINAARAVKQVDRRVVPHSFVYRDWRSHRLFVGNRTLTREEYSTHYEVAGSVRCSDRRGDVSLSGGNWARSFSSIAALPFSIILTRRAAALLEPGPKLSGPITVVLRPQATAALVAHLADLMAPDIRPSTFLNACPAFDRRIHVLDDGRLPGGLRTRAFDDRGIPPVPLTLIKEGVPDQTFLDPSRAHMRDTRPTGHWLDGKLAPTNLTIRGGTRSINALMSEMNINALMLSDLPMHDLDARTGILETVVQGIHLRGKTQSGACRNVKIRVDLAEALTAVRHVTSDTDRIGHVDAPGIILDGFVVD